MPEAYGSEYAVVLPTDNEGTDNLKWALQQRERSQQQKLLLQKQQRDQQEGLAKYVDDQLDYKNLGTGTLADPAIINGIGDLKQKYAAMIKTNPGIGISGLMFDMQKDVGKLTTYSSKAKLIKDNIKSEIEKYKGVEGIDIDALEKGANRSAYLKIDPKTGQPIINDDLDPQQQYASGYLDQYPGKVITGPQALSKTFSTLKTTGYSNTIQTDEKGEKRKVQVTAELLPHQELDFKKGMPVGAKFKTQDLELSDKKKIKGLDENAYQEFFSGPSERGALTLEMQRKHPKLLPGMSDYEPTRRQVAFDVANEFARGGKFSKQDIETDANFRAKQEAGITINTGGKEPKENVFDVLKKIKGGDLSYVSDKTPDENGLVDITSALPGGILYSGRIKKTPDGTASKEAYNNVYYNPEKKTFFVQDEKKGKSSTIREIKGEEEKRIFQNLAEANGVPVKKFLEEWNVPVPKAKPFGGFLGKFMEKMADLAKPSQAKPAAKKEAAPSKKTKYELD